MLQVLVCGAVIVTLSMGIRHGFGLWLQPMTQSQGWTREHFSMKVGQSGALVGHVHFADSNRRAIGLGHTDIAPIAAALRDIGYAGYLSAEILPLPDAETAAAQTMASFCKLTSAGS